MSRSEGRTGWPDFFRIRDPLEALVALSRYYGADPAFVLAGGGNTSVKVGNRLFVKASGQSLAQATVESFVEMDRGRLDELLRAQLPAERTAREEQYKQAILAARVHPEKGQRPSVECLLHHLMPGRFVVHSHPTPVNALTCCLRGRQWAVELFGEQVCWVDFVDPGFVLARTLAQALQEYRRRTGADPEAVLLGNHGLIVGADEPDLLARRTQEVLQRIGQRLGANWSEGALGRVSGLRSDASRLVHVIAPALRGLLAEGPALKVVRYDDSPIMLQLVGSQAGKQLALGGPLTPDQIVYCGSFPLWFDVGPDWEETQLVEQLRTASGEYEKQWRTRPRIVLVRDVGAFAVGDDWEGAETVRAVYQDAVQVMAGAQRLGGVQYLSQEHRQFIEEWEVEAYRRQVAARRPEGCVAGKVALVTGAAQGFGLEIAQHLCAEGAHVILADVNEKGAQAEAQKLVARYGRGRAVGLAIDVSQAASVAACLDQVVRLYGGLDILISNAGVLRAGSVKSQPVEEFDVVTAVNYRGYFLCVQKASPIMAAQHRARPAYWSDIIQINSKSGLRGSNRNGAYAGSKFGGIGLTQSFALELVEDGIKVNAICPGNFFDGPLWSDPENGLFVQYLRTGKVPGARTIQDVRRHYEAQVPMKRGCTTSDVMRAIYYVIEQQYETGQAIPVTGGQVMIN